jgi:predicted nucleic acid-binding protein
MKRLFVDTAGWMACVDAADPRHAACLEVKNRCLESGGQLWTTDYVVDETLTLVRLRLSLDAALRWWESIHSSSRVRLLRLDDSILESARLWFFKHGDKAYSFTDCTSFALMKQSKIRQVLTTDRHFIQAGFDVVVK